MEGAWRQRWDGNEQRVPDVADGLLKRLRPAFGSKGGRLVWVDAEDVEEEVLLVALVERNCAHVLV